MSKQKYPKQSPIPSHKSLATGEKSRNQPKGNSGRTGFEGGAKSK